MSYFSWKIEEIANENYDQMGKMFLAVQISSIESLIDWRKFTVKFYECIEQQKNQKNTNSKCW